MNTSLRLLLAALLCTLLAACGGGGEDEPEADPPSYGPPDCKARPEICL